MNNNNTLKEISSYKNVFIIIISLKNVYNVLLKGF